MHDAHDSGVPAFDATQRCELERLRDPAERGKVVPTACPRCKNPHHKCDMGNPISGSAGVQASDEARP